MRSRGVSVCERNVFPGRPPGLVRRRAGSGRVGEARQPGYPRPRRALVLLDRNHPSRARNPCAFEAGVGVSIDGVITAPATIVPPDLLLVLDNSVAVVAAW